MRRTWILSPEDRGAMLKAYRDGERVRVIAQRFGVGISYPAMLAKRRNVPQRGQGWRRTDDPFAAAYSDV